MIKLLLLSAGTNACFHLAKTLKEKFSDKFFIIGTDVNEEYLVPTKPYLDAFIKVPYTDDPIYYDTIIKACKDMGVDYLLPSMDADQKYFYPEKPDLKDLNIKSFGTNIETIPIYSNKLKMSEVMRKLGLPVPNTYSPAQVNDDDEYFVKPLAGFASIGARKVNGKQIKGLRDSDKFVIQEICYEPEYTVECFYYNKRIHSVTRERIEAKAGVCTKARIYNNITLEQIAFNFAQNIKVPLFFNLQFMKNKQEKYLITDVNLRLAGGMSLSYAAGWDEASSIANIMLDNSEDVIISTLTLNASEQYVVRAYTDIVTKVS